MTENHVFESPPSAGYLDADLGRRLQLLEIHSMERREEADFLKTELASVTGKLTRAVYDIAQEREGRERDRGEIKLLQGENRAQALLIQDLTDQFQELQEEKVAGDESVARTLHQNLNSWKAIGPPPPGFRNSPSRDTPQIAGLTQEQYPSLPQRGPVTGRVSTIPLTPNPYELLTQQNSFAQAVQVMGGGRQQAPLNPEARSYQHLPPLPPCRTAVPPGFAPITHHDQAEQAALGLKLRVTNLPTATHTDITSQVVSFLSENMGVPSTSLKIAVETPTPHTSRSPLIVTCQDIDTKKLILRSKRNLKGNVSTWIEPCLTQWQMAERRKKCAWMYSLRQHGIKAFFHSHRLMRISDGGLIEVTTAPH
jgi:hypothetical protein